MSVHVVRTKRGPLFGTMEVSTGRIALPKTEPRQKSAVRVNRESAKLAKLKQPR
jgi:hypothetical protein